MAKNIERITVSVKTEIELTDAQIKEKKVQLREYVKTLFSVNKVDITMTYEERN